MLAKAGSLSKGQGGKKYQKSKLRKKSNKKISHNSCIMTYQSRVDVGYKEDRKIIFYVLWCVAILHRVRMSS
jgi:hypothetical protein